MLAGQKVAMRRIPSSKAIGKLSFDRPHMLTTREIETVEVIRRFGDDVRHISPGNRPGAKTPDIRWRNSYWEIKTISGASRNNILHAIQAAKTQSQDIILHIPKTKRQSDAIMRDVCGGIARLRGIRQVLVLIGDSYCFLDKNSVK